MVVREESFCVIRRVGVMTALLIVMLVFTDLLSITLNSIVVYTFSQMRSSLVFKDYMMIGMAIGDLVRSLLGYPLEIYSSQHGEWILDIFFCKVFQPLMFSLSSFSFLTLNE